MSLALACILFIYKTGPGVWPWGALSKQPAVHADASRTPPNAHTAGDDAYGPQDIPGDMQEHGVHVLVMLSVPVPVRMGMRMGMRMAIAIPVRVPVPTRPFPLSGCGWRWIAQLSGIHAVLKRHTSPAA
jgi:hypothetical protein